MTAPDLSRNARPVPRWRAWLRPDVGLGLLLSVPILLLALLNLASAGPAGSPLWVWIAGLMFASLTVLWRFPGAVSAAVMVIALLHFLAGTLLGINATFHVGDVMVPVAVFYATWKGSQRDQILALGAGLIGALLLGGWVVTGWPGPDSGLVVANPVSAVLSWLVFAAFIASSVITAWALGLLARSLSRQSVLRSQRLEAELLERERSAELATSEERNRIAREMHDIVAHSLAVIVAQSDGGRYAARSDPAAATTALETIGSTGRSALTEMRRLLGVLRADPGAEYTPQATVDDIPVLVERVADAGLAVTLHRRGRPYPVPPGIGVAAFRVVQESLTNVLKHAGPQASAEVLIDFRSDGLGILVDDDGRGATAPTDGRGHGIIGMRERVAAWDGFLRASPKPGGGFQVAAHWPAGTGATFPQPVPPSAPTPLEATA